MDLDLRVRTHPGYWQGNPQRIDRNFREVLKTALDAALKPNAPKEEFETFRKLVPIKLADIRKIQEAERKKFLEDNNPHIRLDEKFILGREWGLPFAAWPMAEEGQCSNTGECAKLSIYLKKVIEYARQHPESLN